MLIANLSFIYTIIWQCSLSIRRASRTPCESITSFWEKLFSNRPWMGGHRQGLINEALQLIQREWSWEVGKYRSSHGNFHCEAAEMSNRNVNVSLQLRHWHKTLHLILEEGKNCGVGKCQCNLKAVKVSIHLNFLAVFCTALSFLIVLSFSFFGYSCLLSAPKWLCQRWISLASSKH